MLNFGQFIGRRYRIIEHLGNGDFGQVYRAEDIQCKNRPCVVKQLYPKRRDPNNLQKAHELFNREADTLHCLGEDHPQIPKLLAHFEENNEFYLIEDFIDGHPLSDELKPNQPCNSSYTLDLLQNILPVLAFIHQKKVIHRDLKPSNLIRRQKDGKIILIDFGAVKKIQSLSSQSRQTPATVLGTIGYIAPEQSWGNPQPTSDIYALGAIAIQSLTGTQVHHLPKDTQKEILWHDKSVPVSPQLAEIIDKMVRYNCEERYQSADDVLQALNRLQAQNNTPTQPQSNPFTTVPQSPGHPSGQKSRLWTKSNTIAILTLVITGVCATPIIIQAYKHFFPQEVVQLQVYDNQNKGIKINYPANWRVQEGGDVFAETVTFLPPLTEESEAVNARVIVTLENLRRPISIDEYKQSVMQQVQTTGTDAKVSDRSRPTTTLGNRRAYEIRYEITEKNTQWKKLERGTLNDKTAYVITYESPIDAYSKSLNTAQQMMNSFQILP